MQADHIFRNGLIVDGTGAAGFVGDLAVKDGKILAIGQNLQVDAAVEEDASGLVLTPGFIDIHTHYDGQVTWDPVLEASSSNGVTTCVIGNCGVAFAPCKKQDRAFLVDLMDAVEDIPGTALVEGIDWSFETFGEYMALLDSQPRAIDVAVMVGHSPVRVWVLGDRASVSDQARGPTENPVTDDEIEQIAALVKGAVEAGAVGFSTSRLLIHRDKFGVMTPGALAAEKEVLAISRAMAEAGGGVFEMSADFVTYDDIPWDRQKPEAQKQHSDNTWSWIRKISHPTEGFGNAVSFGGLTAGMNGFPREQVDKLEALNAEGCEVMGQPFSRPQGMLWGWWSRMHPFVGCPTFQQIKELPRADGVAALLDEATKVQMLAEVAALPAEMTAMVADFHGVMKWHPSYEPVAFPKDHILRGVAKASGRDMYDVAYDWLCEYGCEGSLWRPLFGVHEGSLDVMGELVVHPNCSPGFGDAGAHVTMMTDSTATTHMLSYWARDRTVGAKIPIELGVKKMTHDQAQLFKMDDRGVLARGMKADLNVIDLQALAIDHPIFKNDLPTGAGRWTQSTRGYVATMVSGVVTYRNDVFTGALPGGVVRNSRSMPSRALPDLAPDDYIIMDQSTAGLDNKKNFDEVLDGAEVLGPSAMAKRERDTLAANQTAAVSVTELAGDGKTSNAVGWTPSLKVDRSKL